jgi:hypothetical protein
MGAEENRRAVEVLTAAFEGIAERARSQRWPAQIVADVAFRSAVSLCLADLGVQETARACAHLAEDLRQLSAFAEGG